MNTQSKVAIAGPYKHGAVELRLIRQPDLIHTLAWRNRDDARIWFKFSEKLSISQHQGWFEQYDSRDDDYLFIVEVEGIAVGQASVYDIDRQTKTAEVGRFLVSPDHVGKGYIDQACGALIAFCKEQLQLEYVFLEVFEQNHRAKRIYLHHGFQAETTKDGLTRMGLRLD